MASPASNNDNPISVYIDAAMFRVKQADPLVEETITIPRAIFERLMAVTDIASKASATHFNDEVLTVERRGDEYIATFEHRLVGKQVGSGTSRLKAIANASWAMKLAADRLIE
jgi:hypothetical protein